MSKLNHLIRLITEPLKLTNTMSTTRRARTAYPPGALNYNVICLSVLLMVLTVLMTFWCQFPCSTFIKRIDNKNEMYTQNYVYYFCCFPYRFSKPKSKWWILIWKRPGSPVPVPHGSAYESFINGDNIRSEVCISCLLSK